MKIGNFVSRVLKTIPYGSFVKMYPSLRNTQLVDVADAVYYERFFKDSKLISNPEACINKALKNKKYILIKEGLWKYQVVNFCFVRDMISNIIWSLDCGYIPIVDVYPNDSDYYSDNGRLWDMFFKQPLGTTEFDAKSARICPLKTSSIKPSMYDVKDTDKSNFWGYILKSFVKYNDSVLKYFDEEYKQLLEDKSAIGCVIRSTDYTKTKPKGHPKQPPLKDVFSKLHEVMQKYNVEYIYLATEDKNIADCFKKEFPDKIIENKRHYFNELFDSADLNRVSQVHFSRQNDDFLKILEYFSSINLVSHCDYLVTGLCGGSEMAIYRNGNQYKYSYVFDNGVY
ncbi:MAG: hypothetical protein SOY57_07940 [Ruminococcus bromii]|mgnify:FL=1|nr:hypothetical protein [Ruminococcus bromii]